jgi:8-oxo-dGTP diphosphatase
VREEAGARIENLGDVSGVYSRSDRDVRFHAVTVVVRAEVSEPEVPPDNPIEIREVRLFADDALPRNIGMGMADMIRDARTTGVFWE